MSKCSSNKCFAQVGNTPVGTFSSLFHFDNENPSNHTQRQPIKSLSKQGTLVTLSLYFFSNLKVGNDTFCMATHRLHEMINRYIYILERS